MPLPESLVKDNIGLYTEVQHFYARQMRCLDEGAVEEWADTFTADGVFKANAHPEPQEGRAAILAGATQAARRLAEQQTQRRHWLGMQQVDENPDGTITVRSYALVFATALGGKAALELSCDCEDLLVRDGGRLQIKRRLVSRDDLPK